LSAEIRELIATIASENPLFGTARVRGELLKLGIVVRSHSIHRCLRRQFQGEDGNGARPGVGAGKTLFRKQHELLVENLILCSVGRMMRSSSTIGTGSPISPD